MIEIWNKDKIRKLTDHEKDGWFDCLNDGLEQDSGLSSSDPMIEERRNKIKARYTAYIEECAKDCRFHKYYVKKDDHVIVSVCRINMDGDGYVLEGLQTHRDFYRMGFATRLIDGMIDDLRKDGVKTVYSKVRTWNEASNRLFLNMGFATCGQEGHDNLYRLDLDAYAGKKLFDRWADAYDQSVKTSEESDSYPFAGYHEVRNRILGLASEKNKGRVLDMGVGTGKITEPLYRLGYKITGVDLSGRMIEIAKEKMPEATWIEGEFRESLSELEGTYDVVIFNYAIHHVSYADQEDLLKRLNRYVKEDGMVIIGDVSTETKEDMEALKHKYQSIWDDDECYPIADMYRSSKLMEIYRIDYIKINEVAGIMVLGKTT